MRGLYLSFFVLILFAGTGFAQESDQSESKAERLPQIPRQDLPGRPGWQRSLVGIYTRVKGWPVVSRWYRLLFWVSWSRMPRPN